MAKSIKLKNNTYIDASGVKMSGNFRRIPLSEFIASAETEYYFTSKSWYRIAEIFMWEESSFNYKPKCLLVHLGADYSWFNGADYLLSICKGGTAISINILNKACGGNIIDQVRIVTKDNKNYLDIHWNVADNNNHGDHFIYNILSFVGGVKVLNPQIVDDSGTIQATKSLL